jgi:hypothetical protein
MARGGQTDFEKSLLAVARRSPGPLLLESKRAFYPQMTRTNSWFSKSRQQGAPQPQEVASDEIGRDKMIRDVRTRCTRVAIAE